MARSPALSGASNRGGAAKITLVLAAKEETQVTQSASVFSSEVDPIGTNNVATATTDVTAVLPPGVTPSPTPPTPTVVPTPTPPATVEATKTPVAPPEVKATETPVLSPTEVPKPDPKPTNVVVDATRVADATPVLVAKPTDTPAAQPKPTTKPTDTPVQAAATTPPTGSTGSQLRPAAVP